MLIAPHAPAATAMHSTAVKPSTGCRWPGAISRPISPVNTTSVITRGFSSAIQSLQSSARRRPATVQPTASLIGQRQYGGPAQLTDTRQFRKVWNGGGEDRVHSSVVAPSPQ